MVNTTGYRCLLILLPALLQACTNSLRVSGDFPQPLIIPSPHTASIYYDKAFRSYIYTEESEDRGKWIIDAGDAQVALFNTVIPGLFASFNEIDHLPDIDHPASNDLVLYPKIVDFQYSIPRETRFKVFEVWIKYNISAYDARGSLVADWIITGYGKTPTAFMQSDEEAMNAAAIVALRDLGANLSLTTLRVPEIKAWLENRGQLPARAHAAESHAEKVETQP